MTQQAFDANESARNLVDAQAKGDNPDCLFQQLSRNEKMETYRALRNVQSSTDDLPDLQLYMGNEGTHIHPAGQEARESFCFQRPEPRPKSRRQETGDSDVWKQFEEMKRKYAPELEAREQERVENPEEPARRIENLADRALAGDESARLDLRRRLESLMRDRNPDYRDAVLNQMVEDGAYLAFNDVPHVVLETGSDGTPDSITFSRKLGLNKETIPLDKSVSQQVDEAQENYVHALRMVVGGLGKFDTEGTLKAHEILMGLEPTNLRWFMLARKEQGRPAVDLNN